jgi:predicted molibdopterin-dependent oxidoreductase YjgC
MLVTTESDRIERHRKTLLSMYAADHDLEKAGSHNELLALLGTHGPPIPLAATQAPREGRPDDPNPYIHFDSDLCILCARCTRYCDEVEAVNAITLANRGSATTIATVGNAGLLDTTCELCGGCIDTCPTGALVEKKALDVTDESVTKVRTTCNYCGVGCQLDLNVSDNRVVKVTSPPPGETVNDGNLCTKGRFAYDFIHHEDRLTTPLIREDGKLRPASWPEAIETAAKGLKGVAERWGPSALGFISSSRCTGEENYLMQKLSRAAFGTNNCHQCAAT